MRRILERVRERMDEKKELWIDFLVCGATPFATGDDVIPEMEAVHDISYVDDASAYTCTALHFTALHCTALHCSPDPQTVIDNVKMYCCNLSRRIPAAWNAIELRSWKV